MIIDMSTLVEVLDKRKKIYITTIDIIDDKNAQIHFQMSNGSEKLAGSLPIEKSKLPLLFKKDETPIVITPKKKEEKQEVAEVMVYKSPTYTAQTLPMPSSKEEPKRHSRRVKCPKTGELISSLQYQENKKKGMYS